MFRKSMCLLVLAITAMGSGPGVAQSQTDDAADRGELLSFKDWKVQCISNEQQVTRCSLFQQVNNDQGQTAITVSLMLRPDGTPLMIFVTPLGVLLPQGLKIVIRNRYYKVLERELFYSHCNRSGCYALSEMDQTLMDVLVGGRALTAHFSIPQGQRVEAEASLYGFSRGFSVLKEKFQ